jgi:transcriptional regulator with XRE-family HTH domain
LRDAKGLSQGDVETRAGLPRTYLSRIENGHTIPTLPVLERWARALDVEMYQLFAVRQGEPEAPGLPERPKVGAPERTLLGLFGQMRAEDRLLLISLARDLVKRKGKRKS